MIFQVKENGINQIPDEEKKAYSVWSLTINPNITLMDSKELELFREAAKMFFNANVLPGFLENADYIEEMNVEYQVEQGSKKKSDHLQAVMEVCSKKGAKIKFDLEKMNKVWNRMLAKFFPDRDERKVYIHVKVGTDYAKTLRQYCNKK